MPTPPPSPDGNLFDGDWIKGKPTAAGTTDRIRAFRKILKDHNDAAALLKAMRAGFLDAAKKRNFLDALEKLYADSNGKELPNRKAIAERLASDAANGDGASFDPFNGWWTGVFQSWDGEKSTAFHPYHVWDPTVDVTTRGRKQCVQAVAQTDAERKEAAGGKTWFPGATRLKRSAKARDSADFAINVFEKGCGVTGWVSKNGGKEVMPHVGFQLDARTLLWVTFVYKPARDGDPYKGTWYGLFFVERAHDRIAPDKVDAPDRKGKAGPLATVYRQYSIRGARCAVKVDCRTVDGETVWTVTFSRPTEICKHRGDYIRFPRVSRPKKLKEYAEDPDATPLSGARPSKMKGALKRAGH